MSLLIRNRDLPAVMSRVQIAICSLALLMYSPSLARANDSWLTLNHLVKFPDAMFNRSGNFDTRPSVPFVALLESAKLRDSIILTMAQAELIDSYTMLVNQAYDDIASFPGSAELGRGVVAAVREADEKIFATLSDDQKQTLLAQRDYHRYLQGILIEQQNIPQLLQTVHQDTYWDEVERPLFLARKAALDSVLSVLNETQLAELRKLVDPKLLYGFKTRTDVLHTQLICEFHASRGVEVPSGCFVDLNFMGFFVMKPDGRVGFYQSGGRSAQIPTVVKLRILSDRKCADKIGLDEDQRFAILDFMEKLAMLHRQISDEHLEKLGDLEVVTPKDLVAENVANDQRYIALENSVLQELEERISEEQKSLLTQQLAFEMTQALGIRWALTRGSLGRLLNVTQEQRERMEVLAQQAADELARKSLDIENRVFETLSSIDPETFKRMRRRVVADGACSCPEAFIPAEVAQVRLDFIERNLREMGSSIQK